MGVEFACVGIRKALIHGGFNRVFAFGDVRMGDGHELHMAEALHFRNHVDAEGADVVDIVRHIRLFNDCRAAGLAMRERGP